MVTSAASKTKDFRQKYRDFGRKAEETGEPVSSFGCNFGDLELAPEKLVVHVVMELHLGTLDDSPEQAWAAVG